MRKMRDGEIKAEAKTKYASYVAAYGLRNAGKIVNELGRMIRKEKARRKTLEMKK